jgi:hypothetical protein
MAYQSILVPFYYHVKGISALGLRIGVWAGLPIEAVCVWISVTYDDALSLYVILRIPIGAMVGYDTAANYEHRSS